MRRRHDTYASGGDRLTDGGGIRLGVHERIHRPREHPVPFNGVEQMRMSCERPPQRAGGWKERMRRDDEATLPLTKTRERLERVDRFGRPAVIEQEHVPAFDRPFDAGKKHNPPQRRVWTKRLDVELAIVKGDRDAVEAELRRPVNQLIRLVRNSIRGV